MVACGRHRQSHSLRRKIVAAVVVVVCGIPSGHAAPLICQQSFSLNENRYAERQLSLPLPPEGFQSLLTTLNGRVARKHSVPESNFAREYWKRNQHFLHFSLHDLALGQLVESLFSPLEEQCYPSPIKLSKSEHALKR